MESSSEILPASIRRSMGAGPRRSATEQLFRSGTDFLIRIIQRSRELLICLEIPFVPPLNVAEEQKQGIPIVFRFAAR